MDERRVLLCPNCGAPLPPGVAHATVMCVFCGVSSALAGLTSQATRSDLACPRCREKLFSGAAQEIAMLGCGLCGGIWLDNERAQRVMLHFDKAVVDLAARASANAVKRPDVRAPVLCALCGNATERRRVTAANVEVDLCRAHGTWFDAGELATVIAAMRAPQMAPTTYAEAPTTTPTSSGVDWGGVAVDVAGNVAVGAFEVLVGILTD